MKRMIAVLMILALAFSVCACGGNGSGSTKDESVKSTAFSTPYAELRLPDSYVGSVKAEVENKDPYTLTFSSGNDGTRLYSLIFNGEGEILLGTILGEKEYTTLYATVYPLDQESENFVDNAEYQEDMDIILANLRSDYSFENGEVLEKPETFEIKTDVVTLCYPTKWKDKVDIKNEADSVTFSSDGTVLFVVSFVDDGGYLLGEYKGHPIYLTLGSLSGIDKESEAYKEMSAMQEDSNVMLDALESDPDFKYAHASE